MIFLFLLEFSVFLRCVDLGQILVKVRRVDSRVKFRKFLSSCLGYLATSLINVSLTKIGTHVFLDMLELSSVMFKFRFRLRQK